MTNWDPKGVMGKAGLFTLHFLWGFCGTLIYTIAALHHGLVTAHSTLFIRTQCILMHRRKLAADLIAALTPEMGAKSTKKKKKKGQSWKRNQTFCLENEMWAETREFFQPTPFSSPPSSFHLLILCSNKYSSSSGPGLTAQSTGWWETLFLALFCETVMYANLN